jgi:adenylate cyclase
MKNNIKKFFKKAVVSPWTALITLSVLVYVIVQAPAFVESVKLRYFDQLITHQNKTDNNIYTVNIDEATLDRYGQWPFKRSVYANIIADLYSRHAGLVVWNVMMPEADRQGGDAALEDTLKDYPVILTNIPADTSKNSAKKPGSAVIGSEFIDSIVTYPGMIANIPSLEAAAAGVGIANTIPEIDGVNRRLPLFVGYAGGLYPSVPLEVLRVMSHDDTFQVKLNENGVEKMRIPSFRPISTDSLGRIWIDWSQTNKQVSAVKLPRDFNHGIVIVGVSAAGLGNPVPTSMGAVYPQDVQAAVIGTLANNVNIERPDWAPGAELLALVLISLIILILSRWVYLGLGVGVVLTASLVPASMYAFAHYKFLVDAIVPTAGVVLVMLHAYGVKFISEFLQKQQIKKQFGSYVSPVIVERLQKNPELIKLGGEEKMLSAVMTDMRNFTGLGERYGADVEGFTAIMNSYMTAISKPVFANNGCLIKFIGDASLHIHGAPLDDERHAYNAVKTALEMIDAVEEFNKHLESIGKPRVGMGAGVNTGKILVGNIGSEGKMGYDVLGDPVSVASRLESQTKSYGVLLIIGPDTAAAVKDDFPVVWLDNIAVKGKTVGLDIYTVGNTVAHMHEEYRKEYTRGDWKKAIKWAKMMVNDDSVTIKEYYEKMIARMEEGLPANWDGTYHATSK